MPGARAATEMCAKKKKKKKKKKKEKNKKKKKKRKEKKRKSALLRAQQTQPLTEPHLARKHFLGHHYG